MDGILNFKVKGQWTLAKHAFSRIWLICKFDRINSWIELNQLFHIRKMLYYLSIWFNTFSLFIILLLPAIHFCLFSPLSSLLPHPFFSAPKFCFYTHHTERVAPRNSDAQCKRNHLYVNFEDLSWQVNCFHTYTKVNSEKLGLTSGKLGRIFKLFDFP